MNQEEFFQKIDQKLAERTLAATATNDKTAKNEDFRKQTVARLLPIAQLYAADLKTRGITLVVSANGGLLTAAMKYRRGGTQAVAFTGTLHGRAEIVTTGTDDDGKNFTGTTGLTYDADNWADKIFIDALQQCVIDYLFYADRHNGIT